MPELSHQIVQLGRGRHRGPDHGACVMELSSMLAGEPFSDHPESVCPVIAGFLRAYNDGLDDHRRQDLYAYAAAAVDTRGERDVERERARRCREFRAGPRPGRRAWFGLPLGRRRRDELAGEAAGHRAATAVGEAPGETLAFLDGLIALSAGRETLGKELVAVTGHAEEAPHSVDTQPR